MRLISALFVLLLIAVPGEVRGQSSDDTLVSRFQLAESYLRAGQFDRAISLLEQLYAADPTSFVFFDRLKDAYENVKRYDDAAALIDDRLAENVTPVLLAEKARIVHVGGDEQAAFEIWDEAVAVAPSVRATYQVVYRSLTEARLFDRAIDLLLKARHALYDETVFRSDLSVLYMATGRFEEAIREQIGLLREDARFLNSITSTLSRYADQPEALEAARVATEVVVREDPLNRGFRELLSWIYLETGDYQAALNENRAIDRLEKQEGRVLLAFAQRATSALAFEAASDAYEEILARYPDGDAAPHALYGLGALHEAWAEQLSEVGAPSDEVNAHLSAALAAYERFSDEYAQHAFYPSVLRSRGRLQMEVLQDLDAAERTLTEVVQRFEGSDQADEARLDLGRIDVLRGEFDSAMIRFNAIVDELRIGDLAEQARFEMALAHFYRGEFDAARTLLNVLDVNTSTDVANDALELKIIIIDNQGPDSLHVPLKQFADAQLLIRRQQFDDALAALDELMALHGRHRIADEARFARAYVLEASGESVAAHRAFAEIPQFHPESHLADRSLLRAAIIQEQSLDDVPGAIETLTRLLTDYPGSMNAQVARERLRRLRGDAL